MMQKQTMTIIMENMADKKFLEWCEDLDRRIFNHLDAAWAGEKLSVERKTRIKRQFYLNMRNEGIENERS